MEWLQNVLDNVFSQAFLAVTGIGGFLWGFYSHYVSNKKPCFSSAHSSFEVIQQGKNTINNLSLSFAGKEIHDLTITKFAIWNSGNKVINGNDMVPTLGLQIVAYNSSEILEAQIVSETEESNNFCINSQSAGQVCLDFEYADSRDGIVLQVLHTGNSDSLKIDGKIKGGEAVKQFGKEVRKSRRVMNRLFDRRISAVLMAVEVAIMLVLISTLTLLEYRMIPWELANKIIGMPDNTTFLLLMMWFIVLAMMGIVWKRLRSAFMVGVPGKLKSFSNIVEY